MYPPDPPSRANFSNHPVGQFTQTSSTNQPDPPSHANWGRRREQRREKGLHTTEEQDHEEESDSSEEPTNDPDNRDEFSNHSISQSIRTSSMNPPNPPSRADISNRLIARELSTIRDDLTNLRSDVEFIRSRSSFPPPDDNGNVAAIKEELKLLHQKIDLIHSQKGYSPPPPPEPTSISSHSHVTITTWNCRGISNSILYTYFIFLKMAQTS